MSEALPRRDRIASLPTGVFFLLCVMASLGGAFVMFSVALVLLVIVAAENTPGGVIVVLTASLIGFILPTVLLKRRRRSNAESVHTQTQAPTTSSDSSQSILTYCPDEMLLGEHRRHPNILSESPRSPAHAESSSILDAPSRPIGQEYTLEKLNADSPVIDTGLGLSKNDGETTSDKNRSNERSHAQMLNQRPVDSTSAWRAYLIRVYNYMGMGVALTGVVAWLTFNAAVTESAGRLALTPFGQMIYSGPAVIVLFLATLGLVFLISWRIGSLNPAMALTLFMVYAALLGVMLSTVFLTYTHTSVASVFFISAASFVALSLWSHTTQRDLSPIGSFLFLGLIGLIIAVLINMLLMSTGLDLLVSAAGVLIFALIAVLGTQRIKEMYATNEGEVLIAEKAALLLYCLVLLFRTDWSQTVQSESQSSNVSFDMNADAINNAAESSRETVSKWYFSEAGRRIGPVSQENLLMLVKRGRLSSNTMVWRAGMKDWVRIVESELAKDINTGSPPPLSAKEISNGYAWALALGPLWATALHYVLVYLYLGPKYGPLAALMVQEALQQTWYFGWLMNAVVALLDYRALKAAGWSSEKLTGWLFIFIPIYLYKRDRMLGDGVTRLLVWVGSLIVSFLPIW